LVNHHVDKSFQSPTIMCKKRVHPGIGLFALFAFLYFSACQTKQQVTVPADCSQATDWLDAGRKERGAKYFQQADSLLRMAANAAMRSGCYDIWAKSRIEISKVVRADGSIQQKKRACDTLRSDLNGKILTLRPDLQPLFRLEVAYIYYTQNNFGAALPLYEQVWAQHETGQTSIHAVGVNVCLPMANMHTRLGEHTKAIYLLKCALGSKSSADSLYYANFHSDLGLAYLDAKDYSRAVNEFRLGLNHENAHPNPDEARRNETRTNLLTNWASTFLALQQPDSARLLAVQSIQIDTTPEALAVLAEVEALAGHFATADLYLRQAESYYTADPLPLDRELAKLIRRRTELAAQADPSGSRGDQWLAQCNEALQLVLPGFQPSNPADNPNPKEFYPENTILEVLDLKSRLAWEQYLRSPLSAQLQFADTTTALALHIADVLADEYGFESSKLLSLELTRDLHERYLQILYERHNRGEANVAGRVFAFCERSRAGLLRQKIALDKRLRTLPAADAGRLQHEHSLRADIVDAKTELAQMEADSETDPQEMEDQRKRIGQLENTHQSLLDSLRKTYPELFNTTQIASLASVQANLDDDSTMLVEYFYHIPTGALYTVAATRHTARLSKTTLAETNVRGFLALISDKKTAQLLVDDPGFLKDIVRQSRQLYDSLLAPAVADFPLRHLVVVPDGVLGSLPFDLLLSRDPSASERTFNQLPYLLRTTAVRFAPSATLLLQARTDCNRTGGYLGVSPDYAGSRFFRPVAYGKECIEKLTRSFGGEMLTGHITYEQFCQSAMPARIVHFYGHGKSNNSEPEFSHLAFCKKDTSVPASMDSVKLDYADDLAVKAELPPEEVPNVLFAHQINLFLSGLQADLVVLSACETGVGKAVGSEGIFSLARAFMGVGCPSTAMTLWAVDDQATARLSEYFLENIRAGQSLDQAMQAAKKRYLDSGAAAAPYYWSGFVFTGAADPIQISGQQQPWLAVALLALIFILLFGVFRFRK